VQDALDRAFLYFRKAPAKWEQLALHGMRCDFSWNRSGQEYLKIYGYPTA
jgi:glycogen synthase